MATIARITTWTAGQVLTASDLNGEFNNIVNDYNGNVTPANFATTLTFTSTQYLDLSAISPSTAKGIRLPAGTGGTNAGNLAWDATAKAGRLGDGTNANYVLNPAAQGTSGQALTSGGANALPTWATTIPTAVTIGAFTIDVSTASGTQAITGVGFQPVAVIFIAGKTQAVEWSVGFDTLTNQSNLSSDYVALAGSISISNAANGFSIDYRENGGTTEYKGLITTLGADGFTITWTKVGSPTGTLRIAYMALK